MNVALPLLFVFLWSTGFVAAALVAPFSEPISILALRFLGASIVLLAFGLLLRGRWPTPARALKIIVSGAFIHGIYLSGVFWGIKNGMPAGISALLMALQPILTAILASPLLGEKVLPRHWLGLLIGLLGCGMVVSAKLTWTGSGITPATIAAHGVALFGIVLGSIYQKKSIGAMDYKTEPGLQLIGGFAVAFPIAFLTESFSFTPTMPLIAGYLWMTLVLSCGAFTLYMLLLERGAATHVARLFYLVPAFSAVEGYLLFGDKLTAVQILGMVVTSLAVVIASNFLRKKPEPVPNLRS